MQGGAEEVLIVLQAVHQEVPGGELASPAYSILPAPTEAASQTPQGAPQPGAKATDADRLRAIYKDVGVEQKHTYGEGVPGSRPPDFTKIPSVHGVPPPNSGGGQPSTAQAQLGIQGQAARAQPAQTQPLQTKTVPPKPSGAATVTKPFPRPPAPEESSEEPADGSGEAVPAPQPSAVQPAPRRNAPPVMVGPNLPKTNLPASPSTNQ
jgi:hypothetical protein